MKKYALKPQVFVATKWDGDYDHIQAAAEGQSAGSSDSFDFNQHSGTLHFVDANGNSASITKGDYLQVEFNADGSFKGYVAVPVAVGDANWVEVTEEVAADEHTEVLPTGDAGSGDAVNAGSGATGGN